MSTRLIQNFNELCTHGEQTARRNILEIVEEGLLRAIPYQETKRIMRVVENTLYIEDNVIPLNNIDHIYVLGVGKGAYPIALALEETLGDYIDQGIVIIKKGDKRRLKKIELIESGHPLPDQAGIDAAYRIREILKAAGERDLIIAPITGGSSAMMNIPPTSVSLKELQLMNDMLLKSGASIAKMNTVRKHLCDMKGGRFAEHASPAQIHTLTLNTATPEMLWPDLVNPDPTTFAEAIEVLQQNNLWNSTPLSIREHLIHGTEEASMETPKIISNNRNYIHYVADPHSACEASARKAKELGYEAHILSTAMEGDAKNLGIFFAGLSNEVSKRDQPFKAPCVLITGGETTVTIGEGKAGIGGPNQETALGYATKLFTRGPAVCVSLDTDGTDGPTDIAGGIADNLTLERAKSLNINLEKELNEHNSSDVLMKLGDAIITGHTGTNIMNLRVVLIEKGKTT